ncbi:Ppx/GppA phosphatase family protein [Corallococcus carmarthensis]|uniref:Ppx/GppA family phosphatase n=1 Tax=Corallococcus carmarthensis TaxID=2316728 RepID=A0A3A8JMK7_9BACT|nr:Ppx/GppA phosphatase family protein [Corallococcus carmarthensis]NOK20281.1 Ppx/GppA family phosphatase [Corallococcus carmarthensis]RKG96997.1 Ppx/GppA family phosphatase [Corallococcus carmarthensis]
MPRFASIDIGTNSVLLLVADRLPDGHFEAVVERAEITRLGRGVDTSRVLSSDGMEATLSVLVAFANEARELGAEGIAVSATSAARDAKNGADFIAAAKARADVTVEIIPGEMEAQLSFAAVAQDFASEAAGPLLVVDIGGGSTEFIYGSDAGTVAFRHSFDVGAVRLTERYVRTDPLSPDERGAIEAHLRDTFSALPPPPPAAMLVGVAGTVTTLYAVQHQMATYDAEAVHGGTLSRGELDALTDRLCSLPLDARRALPGLQPKRADVIPAGALILREAVKALGLDACRVSDRGLRWGLLAHRFGSGSSPS